MFRSLLRPAARSINQRATISSQSVKQSFRIQSVNQSFRCFSNQSINQSNAPSHFILTTSGADEPGIVAKLSEVLHSDLNMNIEESRMAKLGSAFSVIIHVSNNQPNSQIDEHSLVKKVQALFPKFTVAAHPTEAYVSESTDQSINEPIEYTLICEGPDQKGVVSQLTKSLSKLSSSLTIKDLSTDVHSAAFAGYPIFVVQMIVAVDQSIDEPMIQKTLDEFSEKTGFDCWVERTDTQDTEEEPTDGKDE